jgi:hypothetical protein
MLFKVYGGEAMKKLREFEWDKWFKEDRENVECEESNGRPRSRRTDESGEKVRTLVH